MQDINLIPQASKVSQEVVEKTNKLGSVLKLFIVILTITAITAATVYGIIYYRLKLVREEHAKLKQELVSLQKSEQRFILLRDRLDKISKIQAKYNTDDEIQIARDLVQNLQAPSMISTLTITPELVETEITTDSSLSLTKIFSYLIGSGKYSSVSMLSFDYNPTSAYRLSLQIKK